MGSAELDKLVRLSLFLRQTQAEAAEALARVMTAVLKDDTELFKQCMDNEGFRRWMTDTAFGLTYGMPGQKCRIVSTLSTPSNHREPCALGNRVV